MFGFFYFSWTHHGEEIEMIKNLKTIDVYGKIICILIAGIFVVDAVVISGYAQSQTKVIYETKTADQGSIKKKEYYSKRILENEITFLKKEASNQKNKHDQELSRQKQKYERMIKKQKFAFQKTLESSSFPVIDELEKKLLKSEQDLKMQKKADEQALIQKELEFNMKVKALSDQFDKVMAEAKIQEKSDQPSGENKEIKDLQGKIDGLYEQLKIKCPLF